MSYKPNLELNCIGTQEEIPQFLEFEKPIELLTFDLETTCLGRNSDITQIASIAGEEVFQSYVVQRCIISSETSKIIGITYVVDQILYTCMARQYVENSFTWKTHFLDFISFLQSKKNPVLIGHNIKCFD